MFYCIVVLLFTFFMFFSLVFYTLKNGISPMPTSEKVKRALFELLPEKLEGKKIVDLGSGWGSLIFLLARKYQNSQVIGYENSTVPFLFSLALNFYSNLHVKKKDFFTINLQDVDFVCCYLFPKSMEHLKEKFLLELKPGAIILTHTFSILGWKPKKMLEVDDLYKSKIYLYEIPLESNKGIGGEDVSQQGG